MQKKQSKNSWGMNSKNTKAKSHNKNSWEMTSKSKKAKTHKTKVHNSKTTIARTHSKELKANSKAKQNEYAGEFFKLFLDEINDLYSAENQIIKELPKLIKEAVSEDLKEALQNHLKETREQVRRLDQIYRLIGERGAHTPCKGMAGILEEGREMLKHHWHTNNKDAAIIAAAQKVEHYEIASYGTARAHAEHLDFDDIATLLGESLDEEAAADKKLTKLAQGGFFSTGINKLALNEAYAKA